MSLKESLVLAIFAFCIFVDSQLPKLGLPKMGIPKVGIPKIGLLEITRVRAEELYECPDIEDLPIRFRNIVLSQIGPGKVQVDGIIDIKEPMVKPVMLETKMYKCASKSEPDTCEYYHTFRSPEVCALLGMSGRFWSSFTNGTDLPKECPFPEGTYNVSHGLVDMTDMNALPVFESYWKFQNMVYHNTKKLMCVICEFSISPAYRRRHF